MHMIYDGIEKVVSVYTLEKFISNNIIPTLESVGIDASGLYDVNYKFTNMTKTYGKCTTYRNRYRIEVNLSRYLLKAKTSDEKMLFYNTIIHELFHAIDYNRDGHSGRWLALAKTWNEVYGDQCNISQYVGKDERVTMSKMRVAPYKIVINGHAYEYFRQTNAVKCAMRGDGLYLGDDLVPYEFYVNGELKNKVVVETWGCK